jgi:hypothetical protein
MNYSNQIGQLKALGGGAVYSRVEQLREAGILHGAHNLLLQAEITKVAKTLGAITANTSDFIRRGLWTAEIAAKMVEAETTALSEFNAFCDRVIALPAHAIRQYDGRVHKSPHDRMMEANAAARAAAEARANAEQAINDAVTKAVDAVTTAGGFITIIPQVQGGAGDWAVKTWNKVLIVGIPDVSTLHPDVRNTILTHEQRVAAEVLARQAAALAAPAPVIVAAVETVTPVVEAI